MFLMDHIDDVIQAELPNSEDPNLKTLFDIVSKHMIHGPCGHYNPNCVCMNEGKCTN